jgi:hypothetical protein
VLPTDLDYGSPRVKAYQEGQNQQDCEDALDYIDEAQNVAVLHSEKFQQSCGATKRARSDPETSTRETWCFDSDRRAKDAITSRRHGKGHTFAEVLKPGTYKITNEEGEVFANASNIQLLRCSYP